jgi:ATP-dependent Clp protease, protease subunit
MKNIIESELRFEIDYEPILPLIIRVNEFSEESAKDFSIKMSLAHQTGQPVIPIVIDSYGGDVYALMSMISEIKNSDLPVATIIEGKAMSCGACLFCMGSDGYRYMDKYATLMLHDTFNSIEGKVNDLKSTAAHTELLDKKISEIMAENIGQPKSFFIKMQKDGGHSDVYIDAKEALRLNIANHIRIPKMFTKISVDMKFD